MGDLWAAIYSAILRGGDNPLVVAMALVISVLMYDRIRLLNAVDKQSERLEMMTARQYETNLKLVESVHELRVTLAEMRGVLDAFRP